MAPSSPLVTTVRSPDQRWPWWPVFPFYPYGQRKTLVRELVPDRIWSFEQLHGVWYVAVPIRMTVVRLSHGLMLYAPVAPTKEVLDQLHLLEERHGAIRTIVLPTASGLEHKVQVPSMTRAFPDATLWVADGQWSFPLSLPSSWLGFPASRTKVLGRDGFPHSDQFSWIPLGPLELGLGTFLELACLDHASGSLLVTDALVSIPASVPPIYSLDPTPLLFHARDRGSEPLIDTALNRLRGWKRIVLFANYFRPTSIRVPGFKVIMNEILISDNRVPRSHFGFYPFQWSSDWESQADQLIAGSQQQQGFILAPVLERLVFVRARDIFLDWLNNLSTHKEINCLIGAHYDAPLPLKSDQFKEYAEILKHRDWAPSDESWQTLAAIDDNLIKFGVVAE